MLFQSVGAQMDNDLSLYLVLDRGTFSRPLDEDHNGRGGTYLWESTKHEPLVHGPPPWTGSMDRVHQNIDRVH